MKKNIIHAMMASSQAASPPSGGTSWDFYNLDIKNEVYTGIATVCSDLVFSSDGTKFIATPRTTYTTSVVHVYNVPTAWDVMSLPPNLSAEAAYRLTEALVQYQSLYVDSTGTRLFVGDIDLPDQYSVVSYVTSTAYNYSSANITSSYIKYIDVKPSSIAFSSDGTRLFVYGANSYLYTYIMSTAWNLSTATTVGPTLSLGSYITGDARVRFSPDGTKVSLFSTGNKLATYTMSTAWDLSTATLTNSATIGTAPPMFFYGFDNTGTHAYMGAVSDNPAYRLLHKQCVSQAYNIATLTYNPTGKYFIGKDQEYYNVQRNLFFNTAGNRVFVVTADSTTNFYVRSYDLGTAWDISTATTVSVKTYTGFRTQNANISRFYMCSDGYTYFIVDPSNNVRKYTMTTAWDVSTSSYSGNSYTISISSGSLYNITFNSTGTRMYVPVAYSSSTVLRQYALSTAWNLTTASLIGSEISIGSDTNYSNASIFWRFNADETKLWSSHLTERSLQPTNSMSTPGDISTISDLPYWTGRVGSTYIKNNKCLSGCALYNNLLGVCIGDAAKKVYVAKIINVAGTAYRGIEQINVV